jgi:hypothetical protein
MTQAIPVRNGKEILGKAQLLFLSFYDRTESSANVMLATSPKVEAAASA